jgi:anhydro-N-acetylmuramic acid kinase
MTLAQRLGFVSGRERIGVGVLSGTSVDGVDVGLTRLSSVGEKTTVELLAFQTYPIPNAVRTLILKNCDKETASLPQLSTLNVLVAELFAESILRFLKRYRPKRVDFIASHGQTLWHNPKRERIGKFRIRSTFQVGDGTVIAHRTGILTVSNFRTAELVFGKEGAPLAPYLDFMLFRHAQKNRILLNIGGISNLTALKAKAKKEDAIYFDAGAGNVLIDKAAQNFFALPFDRDGTLAANGQVHQGLLKQWLKEPYYRQPPPKSTGREHFTDAYFKRLLADAKGISSTDVIATLTALTARSVAVQIERFIMPKMTVDELIVSGGGANNKTLMKQLEDVLPNVRVIKQDDLIENPIPAKAKEAVLFAVLGNELLSGKSASMQTPALLGVLSFPPK